MTSHCRKKKERHEDVADKGRIRPLEWQQRQCQQCEQHKQWQKNWHLFCGSHNRQPEDLCLFWVTFILCIWRKKCILRRGYETSNQAWVTTGFLEWTVVRSGWETHSIRGLTWLSLLSVKRPHIQPPTDLQGCQCKTVPHGFPFCLGGGRGAGWGVHSDLRAVGILIWDSQSFLVNISPLILPLSNVNPAAAL